MPVLSKKEILSNKEYAPLLQMSALTFTAEQKKLRSEILNKIPQCEFKALLATLHQNAKKANAIALEISLSNSNLDKIFDFGSEKPCDFEAIKIKIFQDLFAAFQSREIDYIKDLQMSKDILNTEKPTAISSELTEMLLKFEQTLNIDIHFGEVTKKLIESNDITNFIKIFERTENPSATMLSFMTYKPSNELKEEKTQQTERQNTRLDNEVIRGLTDYIKSSDKLPTLEEFTKNAKEIFKNTAVSKLTGSDQDYTAPAENKDTDTAKKNFENAFKEKEAKRDEEQFNETRLLLIKLKVALNSLVSSLYKTEAKEGPSPLQTTSMWASSSSSVTRPESKAENQKGLGFKRS